MEDSTMYQTTAIIDIDEELRRQEELINTIKMEPILETTEIVEEETVVQKKKRIRFTDYCLMSMIVVLSVVFIMVIFNVM
jgi:hypothetical protein